MSLTELYQIKHQLQPLIEYEKSTSFRIAQIISILFMIGMFLYIFLKVVNKKSKDTAFISFVVSLILGSFFFMALSYGVHYEGFQHANLASSNQLRVMNTSKYLETDINTDIKYKKRIPKLKRTIKKVKILQQYPNNPLEQKAFKNYQNTLQNKVTHYQKTLKRAKYLKVKPHDYL